jgi:hypothetical protein
MDVRLRPWVAACVATLAVGACAGVPSEPSEWICRKTIRLGGVTADSTRWLDLDGRVRSVWHKWAVDAARGAVDLSLQQWVRGLESRDDSRLILFVVHHAKRHGRPVRAELRAAGADAAPLAVTTAESVPRLREYQLWPTAQAVAEVASAGRQLRLVELDRHGAVLFEAPVDPAALAVGREAMRQAIEGSAEMALRFRTACTLERPEPQVVVVT